MSGFFQSLRARLMLSHLLVVVVGVVTVLITSRLVAAQFFRSHITNMGHMAGMTGAMTTDVEAGFSEAFNQSLLIAVLTSTAAAMIASAFASTRVLRPLRRIRVAARRLAAGSFEERVPVPRETELAALATDVNTLAEALESTEQRRLRLISEVAHELRTPLSTIEGYMEGLLDGVFEPSDEIFAASAREASRLKRLAADLSALSRAEEGMMSLEMETVDLAEIATRAAERLELSFEDKGIALVVDAPISLRVVGDEDRLSQVFTNLLSNALRYTASGGRVEVVARRAGPNALVRVVDDGRGLTDEQLDLVFERFYRVDPDQQSGTGIGLTIARSIARMHGGDLRAESPGLGRGAVFELVVPLAVGDAAAPSAESH